MVKQQKKILKNIEVICFFSNRNSCSDSRDETKHKKVVVWTRVQNSASGIQQYLTGKSSGQSANMRLLGHNEVNYLGEGESLPGLLFIILHKYAFTIKKIHTFFSLNIF